MIENKLEAYADSFRTQKFDSTGQLLIFLSGHGEFKTENGFFLPVDGDPKDIYGTAIHYSVLRPVINNIPCKHILVIIDACYSGTFDPGIAMKDTDWGKRPGELTEKEKLIAEYKKQVSRKFFSSGAKVKTPDESVFMKKLLTGLRSKGGQDKMLTFSELYTYLEKANPRPIHGEFGKDEPGSTFIFFAN